MTTKCKTVKESLKEMSEKEERQSRLHDREQIVRETNAQKRKEDMEQNIKTKILHNIPWPQPHHCHQISPI